MGDELLTRHVTEQLDLPPSAPEFYDAMWAAIEDDQRSAVRRWRRGSIALVAVILLGASAAAAVLARPHAASANVVQGTLSCAAQAQAGLHKIEIWGAVTVPGRGTGYVTIFTAGKIVAAQYIPQIDLTAVTHEVKIDRAVCRPSRAVVPLAPSGLTSNGTITPSFLGSFDGICPTSAARVIVHYRVVFGAAGATRAHVSIRADNKKHTPIAYIDWRPSRMPYFLADRCSPK